MASNAHSPDFIKFLFSSKPKFDCYFEVGNESQGKPERIGAVKLMLMAHSEVFRLKLEDCELQEKQDVPIKDIHPDTFKGILKNVYGHDTTPDMEFDEADNMFYVADKYMIKTLKDKLAMRLIDLLNPDNICSLLKNPACHTNLELDSAITEILRYETDCVLANPQFLWMDADKFLRILQQDELVVPEIELWRAAIKWAKHKANSEDGQVLRQQLSGLTPQLRPYALTAIECHEVISSDILTKDEIKTISLYHGKGVKPQDVGDFSKETEPRKLLENRVGDKPINRMLALTKLTRSGLNSEDEYQYTFTLLTKKNTIELLPMVCQSRPHSRMDPVNLTYKVENTTTITKGAYQFDPPTIVTSSHEVKCGEDFEVPLAVGGRNITLLPNTKYTIKMKLVGCHKLYWSNDSGSGRHGNNHLTLDIIPYCIGSKEHWFPSDKLKYRIVKSAE